MKNIKIKIYTLGCKVNQYDSGKLAGELVRAGFITADKNADIAVINSCAVTKTAIIKSGRMVKLAKKENPKAKIVLAGCWPKTYGIKNIAADFIIAKGEVGEAIKKIANRFSLFKDKIFTPAIAELALTGRTRYFIKIQDGCEQYCSYCVIPYARGKLISRGEKEIIREIERAVKAGYREIVLSGIHLGLYGKTSQLSLRATGGSEAISRTRSLTGDCRVAGAPRNDKLTALLKKLVKIKDLGRIRLSSIEITEVSSELINLMAGSNKICKHLHIPLQSGSDKILKLMNRPYDVKYFSGRIKKIRQIMPDIAITTDVITGFPGETEKDFKDTEKFIKRIKFSRLHVFPYSAHEKTPAAKFPGQVKEKNKAQRAEKLRRLGLKLAEDYKKKFKGRELEITVERIKQDEIIGKTEFYFDILFKKRQLIGGEASQSKKLIGTIVKVKNN
ncbi:MAG: MiaB/RimO family radical SAM methylthiotransferase [Patescibacteria group bacterium]|jgi:threonylcarbamoyladenosine tRNA methylthiotransferase MtaB